MSSEMGRRARKSGLAQLGLLLGLGMQTMKGSIDDMNDAKNQSSKSKPSRRPPQLHVIKPNGTKEYCFREDGTHVCLDDDNCKILRSEVVYKCIAINEKSAIKKFNKNYKNPGSDPHIFD